MIAALSRLEIFAPGQDAQMMTRLFLAAEEGYLCGRASLETKQDEVRNGER